MLAKPSSSVSLSVFTYVWETEEMKFFFFQLLERSYHSVPAKASKYPCLATCTWKPGLPLCYHSVQYIIAEAAVVPSICELDMFFLVWAAGR